MPTLPIESLTPVERAWSEYLQWVRGADSWQYEETERMAWRRLQLALVPAGPVVDVAEGRPVEVDAEGV